MSQHNDLPPAVVAAIAALLAEIAEEDEPEDDRVWARSGRVAPSWGERGQRAWRDDERERGWKP